MPTVMVLSVILFMANQYRRLWCPRMSFCTWCSKITSITFDFSLTGQFFKTYSMSSWISKSGLWEFLEDFLQVWCPSFQPTSSVKALQHNGSLTLVAVQIQKRNSR